MKNDICIDQQYLDWLIITNPHFAKHLFRQSNSYSRKASLAELNIL